MRTGSPEFADRPHLATRWEVPLVSHIVSIKTEVRDPVAIGAACRRLGLPEPARGTAKLFSGEATGLLLRLPDWPYPAVLDTATGQVRFDNYEGRWYDPRHLASFLRAYAVEKAVLRTAEMLTAGSHPGRPTSRQLKASR